MGKALHKGQALDYGDWLPMGNGGLDLEENSTLVRQSLEIKLSEEHTSVGCASRLYSRQGIDVRLFSEQGLDHRRTRGGLWRRSRFAAILFLG